MATTQALSLRVSAAFALTGAALACFGCSSSSDVESSGGRTGTIIVSEAFSGENTTSYELSASWLPSVEDSGCSLTTIGSCLVVSCSSGSVDDSTSLDAGQLSFTSSSGATAMLSLSGTSSYASQSSGSFFAPGDTVTVTGAGGADLPAFAPVSLVAPDAATLLTPACSAGSCPGFDRTQDLTLTWSGQGTGLLEINLGGTTQAQAATCSFDLSAGTGTVPAPVLAVVPSSAALTLTVQAVSSTQFTLGGSPTAFIVAETVASGVSPSTGQ